MGYGGSRGDLWSMGYGVLLNRHFGSVSTAAEAPGVGTEAGTVAGTGIGAVVGTGAGV